MSKVLKSIDLFAGIGGIRLGFDNAFKNEIETVFVSEWDEHAQKTYRDNFADEFEIAGDITRINEQNIPTFDICLAGFPCQAFSLAGKRMGFDDDYKGLCRGTLFQDVVRICDYHKPKVIFCENVKGLTIHDRGRTFKVITKAFEQIGYTVYSKVLNSKDFGVPQNRERIYIVAFRNDINSAEFSFPIGTDDKTCIRDILDDAPISPKYYLSNVSNDIEKFFEKIQLTAIKAKSIDKSDIFISIEDTQTSVVRRHIGFSIKSKFGKDPTLFNTGKNSATVYKLSNMNDDLMDEINSMVDEKNHTAVADRCKALLENGCEFEFVGFPVAARAGCKTFEENLDILNPRLGDTIDYILRTHFLTDETARDVEDMVDIVIEHNPCSLTRPKEKYQYMMKSFLYASYCGLTAGTLWDGKSQVNGGFIAVDEKGNVTANLALESEGFKSYLFKHCYFEWPATSENHGNYAKVYKEGEDYYFRLNFQIRYR